ncbi:hypothetical protein G6F35_012205 [Rhizopus arrhizus]|nr:hypothetical protein G6F35_012205 [Rhizopus arrhizus]
MDPETLGRGHRHVVQLGRQLQPRPGAITLEPDTTAHVGGIVGAFHAHRRGADAPAARFVSPAHHLSCQVQVMAHAESGRPIELQLLAWLQLQAETIGIALETAPQAAQARRMAHAGKAQRFQFTLRPQRAITLAGQLQLTHIQLRPGQEQPVAQAGVEAITQRQRAQRGAGLHVAGTHPQLPADLQLQAVKLLLAVFGLQAQARHLQGPAFGLALPAQACLQALQLQVRSCQVGHRSTIDADVAQVRIGGQRNGGEITQGQPQVQRALAFSQADAAGCQQRRPGVEINRIGAQPGLAVATHAVHIQHRGQWQCVGLRPGTHAHAQAVAVDAQAQVDARQRGIDAQARRAHAEAALDHLQFAQPAQRIQRVTAVG